MSMLCRAFAPIVSVLSILLFTPVTANAADTPHTQVRIFSPVTAVGDQPNVPIGIDVQIEDGWKIYWRTPGDAGLPPAFDWKGSDNFKSASVSWPVPHRFITMDIDNIGYKHNVTFPLDVILERPGEPLKLNLKLDLLVCSDICVPDTKNLTFELPAGTASVSEDEALYSTALASLPADTTESMQFTNSWIDVDDENRHLLVVEGNAKEAPGKDDDLFIEHKSGITFGRPAITFDKDTGDITFRAEIHTTERPEDVEKKLAADEFTLTFAGKSPVTATLPLGQKPTGEAEPALTLKERLNEFDLRIITLALLGGLILNLMPCVLPVLSLKVLSVVSHGGKDDRWTIFKNFMASAFGIIFSFWLMAGTLSAVKTAGGTIGWGIQFQHPLFLVFLVILLLIFAANLWGLFDIHLPRSIARYIPARHQNEPTLLGHFLTGAFATLLATPCTAPFLGTAVGFALARGTLEIFLIFTLLGLGLAIPYIVLAFSPSLFKHMPKPGKWMVKLQRFLSIALLITAIWLANILISVTATPALDPGWQVFDEAKIAPAVDSGKTVFVDVTADWCLTCKANKKLVLETQAVKDMLSADNIVLMQADWTQRDEKIAAYLKKYDRYGIPFNIAYGPGAPNGSVMPELLTKDAVAAALAEAAGE